MKKQQRKHYKTEPPKTEVTMLRCIYHGEPATVETSKLMEKLRPGNEYRELLDYGKKYILSITQQEPSIQLQVRVYTGSRAKQPVGALVYGSLSEFLGDFKIYEQLFPH